MVAVHSRKCQQGDSSYTSCTTLSAVDQIVNTKTLLAKIMADSNCALHPSYGGSSLLDCFRIVNDYIKLLFMDDAFTSQAHEDFGFSLPAAPLTPKIDVCTASTSPENTTSFSAFLSLFAYITYQFAGVSIPTDFTQPLVVLLANK